MTQAALSWIKRVEEAAIDTQALPLSGYPPSFPFEALSNYLNSLLGTTDFSLDIKQATTVSAKNCLKDLGPKPLSLALDLSPIEGQVFFLMGKEEVKELTAFALVHANAQKGFLSTSLQEGFYYYLCTQVAHWINQNQSLEDLYISLNGLGTTPQEECLIYSLRIHCNKRSCLAYLACPATTFQHFKSHFAHKPADFQSPLIQSIPLSLSLCAAEVQLSLKQLKTLRPYDCLLLDRCSWDPDTKKGAVELQLKGKSLLRLRLKDDHLKVLNYVTQEEASMDSPEEDPTFKEQPEPTKSKEHLWESDPDAPSVEESEESLISTEDLPITVKVEVGKVKMSLSELLNLSIGNTLNLSIKPEQGVHLTVEGKIIAKAELVKIGDLLGVRILKLYKDSNQGASPS